MSIVGPTKLILLRTGKFEYAEVELVRPLHLVGPNNVGKTSLIATLQFLYVDDQRHMHFSREMDETRRYYFPDRYRRGPRPCCWTTGRPPGDAAARSRSSKITRSSCILKDSA